MHIIYSLLFLFASFAFMWCSLNILLAAGALAREAPDPNQVRSISANTIIASASFAGMMAYLFIW